MKKYEVTCGMHINTAAANMVALANSSNESVESEFNGNPIIANPGDKSSDIIKKYDDDCAKRAEAYKNSPECKKADEKAKEKQRIHDEEFKKLMADAPEKMTFKDEDAWNESVAKNSDGYGSGVMRYAETWAKCMEGQIAKGISLESCAEKLSYAADNEGITGFMYGCAVSILSQVWIHGEALRRWHNIKNQIGNEGEKANESGGTLNPALLTIGKK